jgi:phage-related tail protein
LFEKNVEDDAALNSKIKDLESKLDEFNKKETEMTTEQEKLRKNMNFARDQCKLKEKEIEELENEVKSMSDFKNVTLLFYFDFHNYSERTDRLPKLTYTIS